ncbi:MAG: hypothetical protein Q8Q08_05615 [Candidatus Omnitrophota bacterium]|nr:hypothetical protein [Candidatus Omnitrophota bacterium]
MVFDAFLKRVQGLPLVDLRALPPEERNSSSLKVQISRWVRAGRLIQLKRSLYLLAEPYRKVNPSELYLAGVLKSPSYVSLEKALEFHGLIPEAVAVYTSVTTKRTESFNTPAGRYEYRHVKPSLFWGYASRTMDGQTVFMALPEKALLDFFYLRHPKVSLDYLREMRLQNAENIALGRLAEYARRFQKKNLTRTVQLIGEYIQTEKKGTKRL